MSWYINTSYYFQCGKRKIDTMYSVLNKINEWNVLILFLLCFGFNSSKILKYNLLDYDTDNNITLK